MVDTDDTRRTMNDGRRKTPRVWHKVPTGELKTTNVTSTFRQQSCGKNYFHSLLDIWKLNEIIYELIHLLFDT